MEKEALKGIKIESKKFEKKYFVNKKFSSSSSSVCQLVNIERDFYDTFC